MAVGLATPLQPASRTPLERLFRARQNNQKIGYFSQPFSREATWGRRSLRIAFV